MAEGELKQRLTAILAADAAGYSRLMAADEHATVAALDAARAVFRKEVEANQGRVIDMAGDSVLAVFETAGGAVGAALTVQKALAESASGLPEDRRMRFRIGIHLGDVIEKIDGTVYGDGVNIAARLEGLAEPGGIAVSEAVRGSVKNRVEASFEDLGKQSVKNISEPVHAYRVTVATSGQPSLKRSVADIDLSLPDRPSIAVLPFTNMSGDPEQEYFSDGVSEDIITELSRFHSLFVIARNSTFSYKGKSPDVRQVGKELGVRYVLEGSIRKAASRIRVTAQLVDSLTGGHIWAEKYDRVLEDVFEVQEELTRSIVAEIAPQIQAAEFEKAHRRRPENLSAYEIAVRAWSHGYEAMAKSDHALRELAEREAREVLALDPRSVGALDLLGWALWQSIVFGGTSVDRNAAFDEGRSVLERAARIDPSHEGTYTIFAWLLISAPEGSRWDEALSYARRGYDLNPNSVGALNALGQIEGYCGNWARGIEHLRVALRISPRDPMIGYVYQGLAHASCCLGAYAEGAEYAQRGINTSPDYSINHAFLAMNLVGLGELERARVEFAHVQRLSPGWVERRVKGSYSVHRRPEDLKRITTLVRVAAGLEQPSAAAAL